MKFEFKCVGRQVRGERDAVVSEGIGMRVERPTDKLREALLA